MSLDARLKQGLNNLAAPIDVDYELGLVRVQAVARRRERRNVMIAAFAGAAAALALLAGGGRLADMVLGIEAPLPSVDNPNVDEDLGVDETRFDEEGDGDRVVQDDELRVDEALDLSDPRQVDGGRTDIAGLANGSSDYVSTSKPAASETDPTQGKQELPSRSERFESQNYTPVNSSVATSGQATCSNGENGACFEFQARDDDRYVTVDIEDASGAPVYAWVQQNVDGDPQSDGGWTDFCASTSDPIPITPGAVVRIMLDSGTCDGADSSPTNGTITVTFLNRL